MTSDLSHVPRRLRRFYRHNMPVPEDLMHIGEKKTEPGPNTKPGLFQKNAARASSSNSANETGSEDELHEPWMDATPGKGFQNPALELPEKSTDEKPLSRREQRRNNRPAPNPSNNPLASLPQNPSSQAGMYSRVLQSGNAQPTPMDHALGLQQKQQFEDHLPSAGEKAIERTPEKKSASAIPPPGNPDLARTLNELRRLAAANADGSAAKTPLQESPVSLSSFHFTPVAGAPNPVDAKSVNTNPTLENMTPRQRMEMRRMRAGTAGFGAAGSTNEKSPAETPASTVPVPSTQSQSLVPAHIRRRMGRVLAPGEEGNSENENANDEKSAESESPAFDDDSGSMKDLLGDDAEKPKKKKNPEKNEDDDLSLDDDLDEDIAPLDDEK